LASLSNILNCICGLLGNKYKIEYDEAIEVVKTLDLMSNDETANIFISNDGNILNIIIS